MPNRLRSRKFFSALNPSAAIPGHKRAENDDMDGGMKHFKPPRVVESTVHLGYPQSAVVGIGIVLFACTILYLTPRTAILGRRVVDRLSRRRCHLEGSRYRLLVQRPVPHSVRLPCLGRFVPS